MPGLRDILEAATRECAPEDVACNFQRDWANEVLADRNHEFVALALDMGEELSTWAAWAERIESVTLDDGEWDGGFASEKTQALLARLDAIGREE